MIMCKTGMKRWSESSSSRRLRLDRSSLVARLQGALGYDPICLPLGVNQQVVFLYGTIVLPI